MVGGAGARLVGGGVEYGETCEGEGAGCGASAPASGMLAVRVMVEGAGTRLGLAGHIKGGDAARTKVNKFTYPLRCQLQSTKR